MKHPKSYDSTPAARRRMSRVRLKGGSAERLLAKRLWHAGFRYRKNDRRLPGSPDLALWKHRVAVFVDGEFWHGYDWETRKERLKSNRDYWIEKIQENIARDRRNDALLQADGWTVLRFWEKQVKRDVDACAEEVFAAVLESICRRSEERGPLPDGE